MTQCLLVKSDPAITPNYQQPLAVYKYSGPATFSLPSNSTYISVTLSLSVVSNHAQAAQKPHATSKIDPAYFPPNKPHKSCLHISRTVFSTPDTPSDFPIRKHYPTHSYFLLLLGHLSHFIFHPIPFLSPCYKWKTTLHFPESILEVDPDFMNIHHQQH